jgi:tRNA(Ile)-lysidine synthase
MTVSVPSGPNLEERARRARFDALPTDAATGHTADDQAETVLVNMLRGGALDGLAGMRPGPRHPILALRRSETRTLCAEVGLDPVVDPSNDDPAFVRNRVRHELVPLLDAIAGRDVAAVISRQAGLIRSDIDLLDDLARRIDPTSAEEVAAHPVSLARRAVREWLRDPSGHPPSAAAVDRVIQVAQMQAAGTEIDGGRRVRRTAGRLRVEDRYPSAPT